MTSAEPLHFLELEAPAKTFEDTSLSVSGSKGGSLIHASVVEDTEDRPSELLALPGARAGFMRSLALTRHRGCKAATMAASLIG